VRRNARIKESRLFYLDPTSWILLRR